MAVVSYGASRVREALSAPSDNRVENLLKGGYQ